MGEDLSRLSAAQLRAKLAAATDANEKALLKKALAAKEAKKPGAGPQHPSPH